MSRKTNRARCWILMLLISAMGVTSMGGCFFVGHDHDHDHDHWHDDHHDDRR